MASLSPGLEAVIMHQERLRERLLKAAHALETAGIPYALVGGNAVAHYVGQVSPGAVRNTAVVDFLLRRGDIEAAKVCLGEAGFEYRNAAGVTMFLDSDDFREAVHIIMAGEKMRPDYAMAAPSLDRVEHTSEGFAVIPFLQLVEMKLTSNRLKDRVHLIDMIETKLLSYETLAQLPESLRPRLQDLLDHPE